ncbi:MAG TPA: TIGR03000 domain-containing protein [Gemmataceae bacterium]|nr:TIGR03000 domain-containing protein [Gemmataceae bacterium]
MNRLASLLHRFRISVLVALVFCLLLLSSSSGMAQYSFSSPSAGLPTYMTSIYYPRIYGSFEYPRPLGFFQPGLQRAEYTTSPTIYSVYTTPPSPFGPQENVLRTALTAVQTTAVVTVWVPADAELRFEGVRTDLRGPFRRFSTPPLIPGREYSYDIQATWTENGQQVTKVRHVPVRAGDRLYVDFRVPQATEEGTRALRTKPLP